MRQETISLMAQPAYVKANVLNEQQPEHEQKEMIMQSFRRIFLPYALMNMHDGCFLLVNRNYKPLGPEVCIKGLTAARAEKIGLKVGKNFYYLYDDATNPEASDANWRRYEAILARLMKLEVDQTEGGTSRGRVRRRRYEERTWSA